MVAPPRRAGGRVPVREGSGRADPPFAWADRGTWETALQGVRAAYLSYVPDLTSPGAAETVAELAEVAVARGVRRLVLLSGRGSPGTRRRSP